MTSFNPTNVFDESSFLFFLTGLFGLRILRIGHQRWISHLYAIFLTVLYCLSFFLIRESMWRYYEGLEDVIYYFKELKFQGYFNLIIIPGIIFSSIFKSSEDLKVYRTLNEIDRLLLYLNSPIDHEIQMKKETIRLFNYLSITLMINLFTYFSLVTADSAYIFIISWFLNFIPPFLEIITLSAFDLFVEKIRVRFEQINRVIGDLLGKKNVSVIVVHSTDINNASKLRLARRIHLKLHDAASAINKAYGLRLFFIFFITLISVLNYFHKAMNLLKSELMFLDICLYLIWTCFHIGKYFHLAISCRAATTEANRPGGFFFEASLAQGSDGFNEEAKALSQQLINRQLQFNFYTVFSIDFPKGLMILIAVLTYFILLA